MLIETFREIAWGVEAHHPADLVDSVFPARDEFACLLESPYAYEIVGSHSGVMLDIPEQESAADVHLLCNVFDRKLMVGNPVGKDLAELLHEGLSVFMGLNVGQCPCLLCDRGGYRHIRVSVLQVQLRFQCSDVFFKAKEFAFLLISRFCW